MRPFKSRFRDRNKREEKYRVNRRIRAPEVRVIGSDGQMAGIMSFLQAMEAAQNQGLDLVEISPNSKPPTCKIMDYGKWKFQTKKKQKQSRKNQAKIVIKEIQLRPRTNEGDINIKLQKAREFLSSGCKVKVNLRFVGREMAHKELGFKILKNIEKSLEDAACVEMPAQMERRSLFTIFAPLGSGVKKKPTQSEKKEPKLPEIQIKSEMTGKSPILTGPEQTSDKQKKPTPPLQAKGDSTENTTSET
ncbi:MAG: translation initiation factor IF-3 [Bdellovibrionales bacterium]|nr:translation initiation factor IF-3 [Bdellovibrionales bacterium]